MPVAKRTSASVSSWDIFLALGRERRESARAPGLSSSVSSFMLFHLPQDGHFPAQFAVSWPHSAQTYTVFFLLAIAFSPSRQIRDVSVN